jgi:hypothetical protein
MLLSLPRRIAHRIANAIRLHPMWATWTTVLVGLVLWVFRRPDQLSNPWVWAEEGVILSKLYSDGFLEAVFAPTSGYIFLPTSFSVALAGEISFRYAPYIMFWLSTAWFALTMLVWLIPRSRLGLPTRIAIVIAMVLVPCGSEMFGLSLYSFWWVGLWPIAVLFWEKSSWTLRIIVLALSGLSGLVASFAFIPFLVRGLVARNRVDFLSGGFLGLFWVLQLSVFLSTPRAGQSSAPLADVLAQAIITPGKYFVGWVPGLGNKVTAGLGAIFIVALVVVLVLSLVRGPRSFAADLSALAASFVVLDILSAIPYPLAIEPYEAGARYHFLPFVMMSWILILLISRYRNIWRLIFLLLLLSSLLTLRPGFSRSHEDVTWTQIVDSCAASDRVSESLPIMIGTSLETAWSISFFTVNCRR